MKDSYTSIHYNEKNRPYTKYAHLFCEHISDKYFKSRKGKLLDVCCGRGEHIEIFNGLGFDAYGVDMDSIAKDKGLKVKIANIDVEDIPYPDNYFDFIMMKSAIEHIRNIYHLIENLYRVLKPGGKIVITTCDWKALHKIFYLDADHKSPFMKCSLHDLLLRFDFKNVNVEYFYHLPYTWNGNFFKCIAGTIRILFPINFDPTVKLNWFIKQIKFAREKQILGYGEK